MTREDRSDHGVQDGRAWARANHPYDDSYTGYRNCDNIQETGFPGPHYAGGYWHGIWTQWCHMYGYGHNPNDCMGTSQCRNRIRNGIPTVCHRGHDLEAVGTYWHPDPKMLAGGRDSCLECKRQRDRAYYLKTRGARPRAGTRGSTQELWENSCSEYGFLRSQGLSPREICAKYDTNWEAFKAHLYTKIGKVHLW